LAVELLLETQEVFMICPGCGIENEMAYSALSNGLVCLEPGCGFEIEMSVPEAQQILEPAGELVCV
jgi:hypothetical protein